MDDDCPYSDLFVSITGESRLVEQQDDDLIRTADREEEMADYLSASVQDDGLSDAIDTPDQMAE